MNRERDGNLNRSPSANSQHGSESSTTRLSDDIALEQASQPASDITDNITITTTDTTNVVSNAIAVLTTNSTNTDVIMLDDNDDDDTETDVNARPITKKEFDDRAYPM